VATSILKALPRGASMLRLGVPPGIGDVYWVLTKLEALRAQFKPRAICLMVQKTSLTRALDWSKMVSFVDKTAELPFRPDLHAKGDGVSFRIPSMNACLWPNALIDRGSHIDDWLPELGPANLSFAIRTVPPIRPPGVVVYISSTGVNSAWCPNLGPVYWRGLIDELTLRAGAPPTLIGAHWDREFATQVGPRAVNLIGQTSLQQVTGIIQRARVLVGVISGMTILANHFRTPCVAIHPIVPMNPRGWVPLDAPYIPIAAPEVPVAPAGLADLACSIMRPDRLA